MPTGPDGAEQTALPSSPRPLVNRTALPHTGASPALLPSAARVASGPPIGRGRSARTTPPIFPSSHSLQFSPRPTIPFLPPHHSFSPPLDSASPNDSPLQTKPCPSPHIIPRPCPAPPVSQSVTMGPLSVILAHTILTEKRHDPHHPFSTGDAARKRHIGERDSLIDETQVRPATSAFCFRRGAALHPPGRVIILRMLQVPPIRRVAHGKQPAFSPSSSPRMRPLCDHAQAPSH
jgi:hypothetical protein